MALGYSTEGGFEQDFKGRMVSLSWNEGLPSKDPKIVETKPVTTGQLSSRRRWERKMAAEMFRALDV